MKLTARASMEYGHRRLRVGETFEASSRDARVLVLIGKAKYVEEPAKAADTAEEPKAAPEITTSRRYRRRDLQARA